MRARGLATSLLCMGIMACSAGEMQSASDLLNGQNGGAFMTTNCTGGADAPGFCTFWTCTNVPAPFSTKVHCTATQPSGGASQPPGPYTCPESAGPVSCPGPAGGSGPWMCTATTATLTCDRNGPGTGMGGGGGTGGGGGGMMFAGCTLTQGYWKNHPAAWPTMSVTMGGVTYSQQELLALYGMSPSGDASLILAHQLITALLNGAAGAGMPGSVVTALANAQNWMAANKDADGRLPYGTSSSSAAGGQATQLSETLDQFNNGRLGPAHCN